MGRIRFSIAGNMAAVALVAADCVVIRSYLSLSSHTLKSIELFVGLLLTANVLTIAFLTLLVRIRRGERSTLLIDFTVTGTLVALAYGAFRSNYPMVTHRVLSFLAGHIHQTYVRVFGGPMGSKVVSPVFTVILSTVCMLAQMSITLVVCWLLNKYRGQFRFWPEYPESA